MPYHTTVPKMAPTTAVAIMAKAPHNVTRPAPITTFAPPARAASPPNNTRLKRVPPATRGMMYVAGLTNIKRSGMAAPTANVTADARAA